LQIVATVSPQLKAIGATMMNLLENEKVLTIAEACAHPLAKRNGKGKKLNRATLWRWANKGVKSVRNPGSQPIRLETAYLGPGTLVTSIETLKRFFEALTLDRAGDDPANNKAKVPRTPKQRGKASDGARQRLVASGFCPD
jgi:hypothetical protein